MHRRTTIFFIFSKKNFKSYPTNLATCVILRHFITIMVEVFTYPKVDCDTSLLHRELEQRDRRIMLITKSSKCSLVSTQGNFSVE